MLATLALLTFAAAPEIEPGHARNGIYADLLRDGWAVVGASVAFDPPTLRDGLPAADEEAAFLAVAGGQARARDLARDSATAPYVLRVRDLPAGDAVVRLADCWFVVHADLSAVDLDRADADAGAESKPVEAGNMRFQTRLLDPDRAGPGPEGVRAWLARVESRLLDRIGARSTGRVEATRTDRSIVVASRTDPAFDDDPEAPNRWWPIDRGGNAGEPQPYAGSAGYVKVSALEHLPGALLVECHFAFVEPKGWFDGAPILRSKIGAVTQDQVRRLRREVARR